jgi:hypothetical protein
MMRPEFAAAILDLAYGTSRAEELRRDAAVTMAMKIAAFAEQKREPWWRWTSWLAAGITVKRIFAVGPHL